MMKPYVILEINEDGTVAVACSGQTRDEAYKNLGDVAEIGKVYGEFRSLGDLIVPRERKATVLSRVQKKAKVHATEKTEHVDPHAEANGNGTLDGEATTGTGNGGQEV